MGGLRGQDSPHIYVPPTLNTMGHRFSGRAVDSQDETYHIVAQMLLSLVAHSWLDSTDGEAHRTTCDSHLQVSYLSVQKSQGPPHPDKAATRRTCEVVALQVPNV